MGRKNSKINSNGFSLVELMVTVSIIGVLAGIAIPNYRLLRVKAYQSEAKASLANLYIAEHSFFLTYESYYANLYAVGFAPSGRVRYNIGFGLIGATPTQYVATGGPVAISSKEICVGSGATGTDTRCQFIIASPNIMNPAAVANATGYVAVAEGYEEQLMAQQQNNYSPVVMVADLILRGFESNASPIIDEEPPTPVILSGETCTSLTGCLTIESWGINERKQIVKTRYYITSM